MPAATQGTVAPDGIMIPPPNAEIQVWKMRVNLVIQQEAQLDSNLESAYALIKGQCSKPIPEKVETQAE